MSAAVVYPHRGRDGVTRWFFIIPGAMDAGPYDTRDEAIGVARLWSGKVLLGRMVEEEDEP